MKRIILTFFTISVCLFAHSQTFDVPDYKFDSQEDYDNYEQDIVKCVDWLVNTPANQQSKKRKEANRFLTLWATGTESFTIRINADITPNVVKSADLMLMYMGGWSKYGIVNKENYNELDAYIAAIETAISFYSNNKSILEKNKDMENFIKMKKNGTLEKYIKEKVE